MPNIDKFMTNDLIRDQIFMHLSPRDVVNYQTATGIRFTTEEFERYVNVFRFIIPQRRWLLDKINNEGYTFTIFCKTLHDFPNAKEGYDKHYVYLFITDKNGDFVSCDEDFIPTAMFENAELDIGLFEHSPDYHIESPTRVLRMRFGDVDEHVLIQMPAEGRVSAMHSRFGLSSWTFEKSQRASGYRGPIHEIDFYMYWSIGYHIFGVMQWNDAFTASRVGWVRLPNESWPTMYAVMDSNGYTIKHLLPMKVRIPGSRESNGSNSNENRKRRPIKTKRTIERKKRGEEVEPEYEIHMSSEDELERSSCSSSDPVALSRWPNQQREKTETLLSLQVLNLRMEWPYKGLIYHIPRTKAECSDKYDGLYRAPPEY